jgi:hypothetical protein
MPNLVHNANERTSKVKWEGGMTKKTNSKHPPLNVHKILNVHGTNQKACQK